LAVAAVWVAGIHAIPIEDVPPTPVTFKGEPPSAVAGSLALSTAVSCSSTP
jgi:hypothetical protein